MSPRNDDSEVPVHLFFDPVPSPDIKKNEITYVKMTTKDSSYGYNLDLRSGRLYRRFDYCSQKDIWGADIEVDKPPMSIGIIPRLLDNSGRAQKIVVFGKNPYVKPFSATRPSVLRSRVVGGVVMQYCEEYPCRKKDDWISRLVLVGVDSFDRKYRHVDNLVKLKEEINWDYFKTFMENGFGRSTPGEISRPAYRLVGETTPRKALIYVFESGLHFKFKRLKKLQLNCHSLYDKLWNNLKALTEKVEASREKPVTEKNLLLGMDHPPENLLKSSQFQQFFYGFHKKYGDTYRMCSKFVRSSNVLMNSERHWRLSFIDAFFNLEKLGFTYVCSSEAWRENPKLASGEYRYDNTEELRECKSQELNRAFNGAVTRLTGLRKSSKPHYHYILYDMGKGGSHQRLYSWNYSTGKELQCEDGKSRPPLADFPVDVTWEPLNLNIKNEMIAN